MFYKIASARKWLNANPSDSICTRNEGTEPRVPVWHSGTCEAFLTHVRSAQEVIEKKRSSRSTYKESSKSYACCAEIEKLGYSGTFANKRNKFQQLQSLLTETTGTSGHTGTSRKSNKVPMRLWLKPVLRAQLPCASTPKTMQKQAAKAADEALTGSYHSIKIKLHLSLSKRPLKRNWYELVHSTRKPKPTRLRLAKPQ